MLLVLPAETLKAASVYHCHSALVPRLPPFTVRILAVPSQVELLLIVTSVGSVEGG